MPAPEPPKIYKEFIRRYPKLAKAWALVRDQGAEGPLDAKMVRLVKLGIAMGAMQEGAVHAGVRKTLAIGATREEIEQVISLLAGTLGFPATVAVFSWTRDEMDRFGSS